jgi:hypothetical protein
VRDFIPPHPNPLPRWGEGIKEKAVSYSLSPRREERAGVRGGREKTLPFEEILNSNPRALSPKEKMEKIELLFPRPLLTRERMSIVKDNKQGDLA